MDAKKAVTAFFVVVFVYFLGIPLFWGAWVPSAMANLPEAWPHDRDLPVQISVRSVHGNVEVSQVRVYVDHTQTRLEGPEQAPYPFLILDKAPRQTWSAFSANRFTYPRTQTLELVIPFARMAGEEQVGPGVFAGNLDIRIDYMGSMGRHRGFMGTFRSSQVAERIPFVMQLE